MGYCHCLGKEMSEGSPKTWQYIAILVGSFILFAPQTLPRPRPQPLRPRPTQAWLHSFFLSFFNNFFSFFYVFFKIKKKQKKKSPMHSSPAPSKKKKKKKKKREQNARVNSKPTLSFCLIWYFFEWVRPLLFLCYFRGLTLWTQCSF